MKYEESEHGQTKRKEYDESESGKERKQKYERKVLLNSYETDTGFNAICCSCNEYKSKESCSNVFKKNTNESKFENTSKTAFFTFSSTLYRGGSQHD